MPNQYARPPQLADNPRLDPRFWVVVGILVLVAILIGRSTGAFDGFGGGIAIVSEAQRQNAEMENELQQVLPDLPKE